MSDAIDHVRREIRDRIGQERLKALHKPNRWLDYGALIVVPGLFLLFAWILATQPFGVLWVVVLVLQGFLLQIFALMNHDLLMHRAVLPRPLNYLVSLLLMIPAHLSPTRYRYGHNAHHRYLGGDGDSELFKMDIDTRGKRLLYATFIGLKMASAGKFARVRRKMNPPIISADMTEVRARVQMENRLVAAWLVLSIVLAIIWPYAVGLGYLLPLLLVSPIANTFRTFLEHSEFDADNPFQMGCFYRTGFITRPLFFWDSGDCHFVHHVFPGIPFYRIGAAVDEMRAVFLENGAVERRNIWAVLWRWFRAERRYRGEALLN